MLHIVQVVLAGSAEMPQVFVDEEAARAAFVACAKKYWSQAFAAHCEKTSVDSESFSSAQAFVATFDLADRSRIHYWSTEPVDAPCGTQPGLGRLAEQQRLIERLAGEVERASGAVRDGVTELLATIAEVTGEKVGAAVQPVTEPDEPRPLAAVNDSTSPAPQALPQPAVAPCTTREWKEYVESIKNMCGGSRNEYHLFTRSDWRQAVYGGQTSFEYWEWLAATIDHYIEQAQRAGYAVIPDPDNPGRYRFRTPDGIVSDIPTDAEGEAWCRAGLHLEGK